MSGVADEAEADDDGAGVDSHDELGDDFKGKPITASFDGEPVVGGGLVAEAFVV